MGAIVFLRPVLWYLEGRKREAVLLLGFTIFFLFLAAAATMVFAVLASGPYDSVPLPRPMGG